MFEVPYAIDKTNLEDHFLRNQIRHQIVEKMNEQERKDILKEIDEQNKQLAAIIEKVSKIESNSIDEYNRLNDDEFLYAIVALGRKLKSDFTISKKQGEEIRKILLSDKANVSLEIDGLLFYKEYDAISFKEKVDSENFEFTLSEPGVLDTKYFFLDFSKDSLRRNVFPNDYPLTIRNARADDVYQILGYTKELRRLFIDWKMPKSLRSRWPIIINKDGVIVYVPRYQKDFVAGENCNFYVKL